MKRYFLIFATLSSVLLLTAFFLGIGVLNERAQGMVPPQLDQPLKATWFTWHMIIALVAVLFNLFVHCLVFTYLLGTGKWVKEVAAAYSLPSEGWPKMTRQFKVEINRYLLMAMAMSILAAVTGAGSQTDPHGWWPIAHALLAVMVLFVNGWVFWVEYRVILKNEVVLEEVKRAADSLRGSAVEGEA